MGNDVTEVVGFTDRLSHPYIEAEDFGIALVKFVNGAYGLIEGTTNIYPENFEESLCIFGGKGTIKAGGKSVNIIEHWRFDDNLDDSEQVMKECGKEPPNVYGFGHIPLYRDVIDSIKNGKQPYVDAYAGKRALELVLAIYKSAKEKSIIKLPLKDCEVRDFS